MMMELIVEMNLLLSQITVRVCCLCNEYENKIYFEMNRTNDICVVSLKKTKTKQNFLTIYELRFKIGSERSNRFSFGQFQNKTKATKSKTGKVNVNIQ